MIYKKIFHFSFWFFILALIVEFIIGSFTPIELRPRKGNIYDIIFFVVPFLSTILFGVLWFLEKIKIKLKERAQKK